jgi:5-methylcytosine-specific restriction protein A
MRQEFPRKVKAAAFTRCNGFCESCGIKLHPGRFDYHHIVEAHDLGPPTLENCAVICEPCHAPLTAHYTRELRKAERIRDKRTGAMSKPSTPLPGSRRSKWKHTFMHGWVPR